MTYEKPKVESRRELTALLAGKVSPGPDQAET
jgi:hypothetical protein